MVTTILSGGLGNQMFQYAAGRALSLRLNTEMSVDTYKLQKKSLAIRRDYQLDVFAMPVHIVQSAKVRFAVKSFLYLKDSCWGKKMFGLLNVFTENGSYDTNFGNLDGNVVLFGYFQNEKYFGEYEKQIREDFTFRQALHGRNKELAQQIMQSESVSIHIRRGDYISAATNQALLGMDYYSRAIKHMVEKTEKPSFYIFSDDADWVRENLNLTGYPCVYVGWNTGESSYIDMQLMACCKHNVIANSSFSWWGAWLNANPGKVVVAPSVWYKKPKESSYPEGFIPGGWTVL